MLNLLAKARGLLLHLRKLSEAVEQVVLRHRLQVALALQRAHRRRPLPVEHERELARAPRVEHQRRPQRHPSCTSV